MIMLQRNPAIVFLPPQERTSYVVLEPSWIQNCVREITPHSSVAALRYTGTRILAEYHGTRVGRFEPFVVLRETS